MEADGVKLSPKDYLTLGIAYLKTDNTNKAQEVSQALKNLSASSAWLNYSIAEHNHDYASAFFNLKEEFYKQDSIFDAVKMQETSKSIQDYYQYKESHYQEIIKKRDEIRNLTLAIAIIAFLLVIMVLITVNYKQVLKAREKQSEIELLNESISRFSDAACPRNIKLNEIFGSKLKVINDLCLTYMECDISAHKDKNKIQGRIYNELAKIIEDIKSNGPFLLELEHKANVGASGLLENLKKEMPGLSPLDYRLFLLTMLGFNVPIVALFLDIDRKSVYNRRHRLKKRIEGSCIPRKEEYLAVLNG